MQIRVRELVLVAVFVGVQALAPAASAHHAFAPEFDIDKPVKLKGMITKIEWINPHGWIHLDVRGEDGSVTSWAVETGGPTELLRKGVRKSDFPVGVEVVVNGYLAKSGKPVVSSNSVEFPDGRSFFTAASSTPGERRR